METLGNQKALPLAFGVHHAAKDAPSQIVRQIESAAHALAVMIRAGHHKLEYVAACIGKSKSYVSRMQNGVRPIPEKLVGPCAPRLAPISFASSSACRPPLTASARLSAWPT
ncbi:hypothetical protein SNK04_014349 [Fusarium graminearum]